MKPRSFRFPAFTSRAGKSATLGLFLAPLAFAKEPTPSPDRAAFRATYKELVETNTTLSAGDCTIAVQRMAQRLKAAGFPESDLHIFTPPDHPKEGGLVAVLHGADANRKAILLLAHIDVVEAKREDWQRDPFTLVEEGGYFYARGTSDDKAMAAIWVDTLIRLRQEKFKPRRDLKMALTCGEETETAVNGVQYLIDHERDLIDAAFAINEGAGGELDETGNRVVLQVEAGEKTYQDYRFEVTNPGGHSSQPVKDNAIYHLAVALSRVSAYEFPVQFNDTTRAYFTKLAEIKGGETGKAMRALMRDPQNIAADAEVSKDKQWHSMLRTTCVATMVDAGHAVNALPQRARANVNCRLFPGTSVDAVRQTLVEAVDDGVVAIAPVLPASNGAPAPPLTKAIMDPVEAVSREIYPGTPVVPVLTTGATDGINLTAVGIPTYGIEGMFVDPDNGNIHGLNERIRVKALYDGRDFLFKLVKIYASQK